MAVSVSGTKTVTIAIAPHLTAAQLTTLLGTAVENLTVAQFNQLKDALGRVASGHAETKTIGALFV